MIGTQGQVGPTGSQHHRPFTHRIFIDFSGDDGTPTTPGSSRNLCIAWIACKEENLSHNLGVLAEMKRHIGCKPDDELKYRALRRHKKKTSALEILMKARMDVFVFPVIKERLQESDLRNPGTKKLIHLLHSFPLDIAVDYIADDDPDLLFQLVFDRIGWKGSQGQIEQMFQKNPRLDYPHARPDWLEFMDWRQRPLLQVADIVAGLCSEYLNTLDHHDRPPCEVCWLNRRSKGWQRPKRCKEIAQLGDTGLFFLLRALLSKDSSGNVHEVSFVVRPPTVRLEFAFVDCPIILKKEKAAVRAG